MRYEVRFSNGAWKLFDTRFYTSVACFGLMWQALNACEAENMLAARNQQAHATR